MFIRLTGRSYRFKHAGCTDWACCFQIMTKPWLSWLPAGHAGCGSFGSRVQQQGGQILEGTLHTVLKECVFASDLAVLWQSHLLSRNTSINIYKLFLPLSLSLPSRCLYRYSFSEVTLFVLLVESLLPTTRIKTAEIARFIAFWKVN